MINTFHWACREGHISIVKDLLLVVDPSVDDSYAIRYASYFGHTEVVRLLLIDNRVNPKALNNYPWRISNSKGFTEIVKMLEEVDCEKTYRW